MIDRKILKTAVSTFMRENDLRQKDLAEQVGVSQSVVSRAINCQWKRYSRSLKRLSHFVDAKANLVDPRQSELLMNALGQLWDGSPEQEERLANLLINMGELRFRDSS